MLLQKRIAMMGRSVSNAEELVSVYQHRFSKACDAIQPHVQQTLKRIAVERLNELTDEQRVAHQSDLVELATYVGKIGAEYSVKLFGHPTAGATTALLSQHIGSLLGGDGHLPTYMTYNLFLRNVFFSEYPIERLYQGMNDVEESAAQLLAGIILSSGEVV